jgi:hypothetical protein
MEQIKAMREYVDTHNKVFSDDTVSMNVVDPKDIKYVEDQQNGIMAILDELDEHMKKIESKTK